MNLQSSKISSRYSIEWLRENAKAVFRKCEDYVNWTVKENVSLRKPEDYCEVSYKHLKNERWLIYVVGKPGIGKTGLAICLIKMLAEKFTWLTNTWANEYEYIQIHDQRSLTKFLHSNSQYNQEDYVNAIELLKNYTVLFIDEVYEISDDLETILKYRYDNKLVTIVCSNIEFKCHESIISRMQEGLMLELPAVDYRA